MKPRRNLLPPSCAKAWVPAARHRGLASRAMALGRHSSNPRLRRFAKAGADVRFGARVRDLQFHDDALTCFNSGNETIELATEDRVVLAVPPWIAVDLVPALTAPDAHRAILNAHFVVPAPDGLPLITGLVGGMSEWLFAFHDRLSVTVSAADAHIDAPREELATRLWAEISAVTGLPKALPPWQIVKEKRATFAATPEQDRRRPPAQTRWRNLFLAGDWTQTGLPSTIEGAIRSGDRAAALASAA